MNKLFGEYKKEKLGFRVCLSPLVFILGLAIAIGGWIFPITMISAIGLFQLIACPFVWLFNKAGSNIVFDQAFVTISRYHSINSLLEITITIWLPFYGMIYYINSGEIIYK